jgi:hypothetical protein
MRTFLDRLLPSQRGYPVELMIGAGEPGHAARLRHRDDQGVVAEESGLPAQSRSRREQRDGDREDLGAELLTLHGPFHPLPALRFTPDGRTLAFRAAADGKRRAYLLSTALPEDATSEEIP